MLKLKFSKQVKYRHKVTKVDLWSRIESWNKPTNIWATVFNDDTKAVLWRKNHFLTKWSRNNWISTCKDKQAKVFKLYFASHTEIKWKWIVGLYVKPKIPGRKPLWHWLRQRFLLYDTKITTLPTLQTSAIQKALLRGWKNKLQTGRTFLEDMYLMKAKNTQDSQ